MLSTTAALAASGSDRVTPQPRLVRAAHEFEAQMMKELLKPMTSGDALTRGDEDSGSGGAFGEFAFGGFGAGAERARRLSGWPPASCGIFPNW